ncbi:hypothetical protein Rxycam_01173 [Rubrobacter xylanophilus DSM 9941]|uniref:DUF429 domain-containing protein n=1 Tax=Rubrobacter xylanophilus TaxID=49319 RepID=UPI001C63DDD7|nr:DUF429 domain-containing protein [Rubrobacter xylanophilus]QYJ15352.1 hypothetical protein Rxycam_01173 [Rubrobacter xylanophilus DSM 9941]
MRICGLDFTSSPGGRKPLVAVGCDLDGGLLRVETAEEMKSFRELEEFLGRPGPWVCGMDFPFGQPKELVEALGWSRSWEGYVSAVSRLTKEKFEATLRTDMATRPPGAKHLYRHTDRRAGSASAMMLFRVPVAKMFYRGAPLLLASGVSVVPCRPTDDPRVAVESYPALVARRVLGRGGYKQDGGREDPARRAAREQLVEALEVPGPVSRAYGLSARIPAALREHMVREPSADTLDSLLCALQAAWACLRRKSGWGIPPDCDRDEGWIVDPSTLEPI